MVVLFTKKFPVNHRSLCSLPINIFYRVIVKNCDFNVSINNGFTNKILIIVSISSEFLYCSLLEDWSHMISPAVNNVIAKLAKKNSMQGKTLPNRTKRHTL